MYHDPEYLQQGYSQLSNLINKFKTIWRKDYLTSLRERHRTVSLDQVVPVDVGDLVLVECTTHREYWPLAKVTKLLPDQHGQVRAVEVLVDGQLAIKTLNKLVKLEVSPSHVAKEDTSPVELVAPPVSTEDVVVPPASTEDATQPLSDTEELTDSDEPDAGTDSEAEGTDPPTATAVVNNSTDRPRRQAADRARGLFVELGARDDI